MLEWIVGLGIPTVGGIIAVTKYILDMKSKIKELSAHDESSIDVHTNYEERLQLIESNQVKFDKRQVKNEIYLRLLLDDRGIKHD